MTFISLECEKLTKEYTSSDNPFGFKKDKRIEKWVNLLAKIPNLQDTKIDLLSGVHIKGDSYNFDEEAIEEINAFTQKEFELCVAMIEVIGCIIKYHQANFLPFYEIHLTLQLLVLLGLFHLIHHYI